MALLILLTSLSGCSAETWKRSTYGRYNTKPKGIVNEAWKGVVLKQNPMTRTNVNAKPPKIEIQPLLDTV